MRSITYLILLMMLCTVAYAADEPTAASLRLPQQTTASSDWQMLNQDPDPAMPGSYVELRFKIENIGREALDNVVFQLEPEYPFTLSPDDNGKRSLGKVNAGLIGENAYILYYRLKVDEDAVENDYTVKLKYSEDDGYSWIRLEPFDVRVKTEDTILNIKKLSTTPTVIQPGEEFKLDIEIENMADSFVKNLRVNLGLVQELQAAAGITLNEVPFSPINSSNEKVIKILGEDENIVVSFSLIADADSELKTYKFPLTLTYLDESGDQYSKEEIISFQVGSRPDLIAFLDSTSPMIIGSDETLSVKFVNKGISDIKFLYAMLDSSSDYDVTSSDQVYIGNIDSDDYETADFNIKCNDCKTGELSFPIKVEFLDEKNNKYSEDFVVKRKVYTQEDALAEGLIKKSNTIGYLIIIVVVILGFIAYRVFRKKKK